MVSTPGVRIGTSGWHYQHWVGPFYPPGTPSETFLRHYSDRFDTVEINHTFYQLPDSDTVAAWRRAVPAGFLFSCKASRYITHLKKLKDPAKSTRRFFAAVERLGDFQGPILFQLPPHWHRDVARLAAFLKTLPQRHRYAFEFRDPTWFSDEVHHLLASHGAAFCIYELGGVRTPIVVTAGFVYLRLHGPGRPYQGRYDGRTLRGWARRFATWRREGRDVFCYFDNDQRGYAALDAQRLYHMVHAAPARP
jgi:uncharacterized protein YecE (DUF72 family)